MADILGGILAAILIIAVWLSIMEIDWGTDSSSILNRQKFKYALKSLFSCNH